MYIKHTVSNDAQGAEPTIFIEGSECTSKEELDKVFTQLALEIWEQMLKEFGYPRVNYRWVGDKVGDKVGNKLVMYVIGQENLFNSLEIVLDK